MVEQVKTQEYVWVRLERNKRDGEVRHTNAGVGHPLTHLLRYSGGRTTARILQIWEPGLCHTGPCALYRICPIAHTLNNKKHQMATPNFGVIPVRKGHVLGWDGKNVTRVRSNGKVSRR